MKKNTLHTLWGVIRNGLACAAFVGLVACGGGAQEGVEGESATSTKLYVGMTDAEGDFLTYKVDVSAITLVRANGAEVNVLPRSTSVDFAQYVEVSELLTVIDAPVGVYRSASITLDFSDAQITVQAEDGSPVAAVAVDADGETLGEVAVDLRFNDRSGFVLSPGVVAQVVLDFDLDASSTINMEADPVEVTVQPIVVADTFWGDAKPFRLRGLLGDADAESDSLSLVLRPFRVRNGNWGSVTVSVAEDAVIHVDGEVYAQAEGMLALEAKAAGTALITEGTWDRTQRRYIATQIAAGSSVPWGESDILRGTVIAREGNSMTVKGGVVELVDGRFIFNDDIQLSVSENTMISWRAGDGATLADISVGSALYATGEFTNSSAAGFNAEAGIVRLVPTTLAGEVVSVSPLAVDLFLLNGRRPELYEFSGTGSSAETDADPEHYEIFTGSLDLSGVELGAPVRARGFVQAFGAAPEDFNATTVIDASAARAHLYAGYGVLGSSTAINDLDATGMTLNLSLNTVLHHLVVAGIAIDLDVGLVQPRIEPANERGIFSVWVDGRLEVFSYYADFQSALQAYLDADERVLRVDGHGRYSSSAQVLSADRIGVILR